MSDRKQIFVTGGSGFIGGHLLDGLAGEQTSARALSRETTERQRQVAPNIEWVQGDLLAPESFESQIQSDATVIHLAATTGKASRAEHLKGNLTSTLRLLECCRKRKVRGFLFVSSIVAGFSDKRRYPYAEAKEEAEKAVRASGLPWTIVRPTIVCGRNAPVVAALEKLALLPVLVIPGDGRAKVQPIFVEDLVNSLRAIIATDRFREETLELGGPEVLSIEAFLQAIRRAHGLPRARAMHLPLKPVLALLGLLEPLALGLLPVTAGQLATFGADGIAGGKPPQTSSGAPLLTTEQMLRAGME